MMYIGGSQFVYDPGRTTLIDFDLIPTLFMTTVLTDVNYEQRINNDLLLGDLEESDKKKQSPCAARTVQDVCGPVRSWSRWWIGGSGEALGSTVEVMWEQDDQQPWSATGSSESGGGLRCLPVSETPQRPAEALLGC